MRLLSLCAVFVALACGGSESTTPTSITGSYALKTVSGQSLPATLAAFGGTTGQDVITGGTFLVNADGTWTIKLNASSVGRGSGLATRDCCYGGAWTQSGSAITLQANPANEWTGTSVVVSNSTLIYAERGYVMVFGKT